MDKTPYNPTIQLRCSKCAHKTPHVLISFSNDPTTSITMLYECQDCGETKKIFDLETLPHMTFEPTRNVTVKEKEQPIPVENSPQIQQSA